MAGKQVSAEQLKVMAIFMAEPSEWFDSNAIGLKTGIPGSTVRHFLFTFLRLGLLDRVEVHGGYLYRLSPRVGTQPYFRRLQEAAGAMKP